jgi:hypothetical protein
MIVFNHLRSQMHQLLWGGTTIDWGDVQPEDNPGIVLTNSSHPSIDIYDNAMMTLALKDYAALLELAGDSEAAANWTAVAKVRIITICESLIKNFVLSSLFYFFVSLYAPSRWLKCYERIKPFVLALTELLWGGGLFFLSFIVCLFVCLFINGLCG